MPSSATRDRKCPGKVSPIVPDFDEGQGGAGQAECDSMQPACGWAKGQHGMAGHIEAAHNMGHPAAFTVDPAMSSLAGLVVQHLKGL